jgi:hypothetical protein
MKTINDAMVDIIEKEVSKNDSIIREKKININRCKSMIRYAVDIAVDDSKDVDRSVSDYINKIQIICRKE